MNQPSLIPQHVVCTDAQPVARQDVRKCPSPPSNPTPRSTQRAWDSDLSCGTGKPHACFPHQAWQTGGPLKLTGLCVRTCHNWLPPSPKVFLSFLAKDGTKGDGLGITLPTKVHLVEVMVFPVVMYGCESWITKKTEQQRIDAFELWCWRRLSRVHWTGRRSNQSILKEITGRTDAEAETPVLWPPDGKN